MTAAKAATHAQSPECDRRELLYIIAHEFLSDNSES